MNNGFTSLGGASLHGLVDINSDSVSSNVISSSTMNTDTLILGGVNILNLIDTNSTDISTINQKITDITYNTIGDLKTIDNNVKITGTTTQVGVTLSGNLNIRDGVNGLNFSGIYQLSQQLNIGNTMYNNTITTITGLIPSGNVSCIVRTDAITAPLLNGRVTGDNINSLATNNLYINSVYISSVTLISGSPLTQIGISTVGPPIGTTFISGIGSSFAVGTYITAYLGSGIYQLNQATLTTIPKSTFSSMLISLNKSLSTTAVGNIYLDYNPCINIQLPLFMGETRNMITIDNTDGITMGTAVTCQFIPNLGNHLTNKTYVDALVASSSSYLQI